MDKKAQLIEQIKETREKMRAVVAKASLDTQVYPPWRIKQVLDHLAGWDDAATSILRAHLAGNEPEIFAAQGADVYNAQTVSTREALSFEHTLKEWKFSREQLLAVVHEIPAERLDDPILAPWGQMVTVAEIVGGYVLHEGGHADEIMEILNSR